MKVLLDTNIILDILLQREPHYLHAIEVLRLAERGQIECHITANSITDIFYILRKYLSDPKDRELAIRNILQLVNIVGITKKDIIKSFELQYTDFEDALQTQCAKKLKADYIITRNEKDFKSLTVKVVSAEQFIEIAKNF